LAHFAEGNTLGKLGVFFLGQAGLDYPVAVGRIVFFHGRRPPFFLCFALSLIGEKQGHKRKCFLKNPKKFSGIFQSGASRKRRAWGGNPNKIPAGQN
jgi:hypothetical protein